LGSGVSVPSTRDDDVQGSDADEGMAHPVAEVALAEGCSRIEAALWALIGDQVGADPGHTPERLHTGIRRYVAERRRGDASAATLLALLRQAAPPMRATSWGP
jgi:hypothetical protein